MGKPFDKNLATIITKDGNQFLYVPENGIVKHQISSHVIDEINEIPRARITLLCNICSSIEEAERKYKE